MSQMSRKEKQDFYFDSYVFFPLKPSLRRYNVL